MKTSHTWLLILAAFVLLAIATKPTDQQCIDAAAAAQAGVVGELSNQLGISQYGYTVEDHIIYKDVYSSITGRHVATGIFGSVSVEK